MDQTNETPTPQYEKTPWELAQEQSQPKKVEPQTKMIPPKRPLSQRLLMSIFVMSLLWGIYFVSPLSKPAAIEIVGTQQVTPEEVIASSGISSKQTIWSILAEHELIDQHLQQSTKKIKAASVTLTKWNQITITIQENPAVGYYEVDNTYYELLADNQTLALTQFPTNETVPLLVGFSEETLKQLATQFDKVSPTILSQISQVTYSGNTGNRLKITMKMKDGLRVVGSLKDIGDKLNYYPGIVSQLTQKTGTIDMEVGIFYTPDVNAQ